MKNKEFTKVYEGLQSLIRVAMGDSVSNDTYFEFKKYFRYPGELLERMEQYGYGSADDYLSAIAALRWAKNRKLDISEMCVGTQLEDFLKKWRGALIMVTHDRYFLDSVCNRIVEVDKGSIYSYDANYSGYLELKAEREEMQQASERKRQNILRKELEWIRRGAKARTRSE